ncbi:MAG: protein translocase subunit SecF [Coriobacteriia bacterium]|nr:protein translocase subunit SecF [Coriobacteriia bacterium]
MPKYHIDFMGLRKVFFTFSIVLILISIGSLAIRGLQFGIDFKGGTVITIGNGQGKSIEEVRSAFEGAKFGNVAVQTSRSANASGYLVRSTTTDPDTANNYATAAAEKLGMNVKDFSISTIGAGWGKKLTSSALTALAISIIAILIYISIRFEYKMSLMAVAALFHDVLITLGIYSLLGAEVSTSTIAALLTILGYSLYDTVVIFGRIKENTDNLQKMSFMGMANLSINEVFARSINTTVTSLLPVLVMLFMNVEVLNGFAIALTIGLFIGAYSSIGVAAPLYAMWKETEPKYVALRKKYGKKDAASV